MLGWEPAELSSHEGFGLQNVVFVGTFSPRLRARALAGQLVQGCLCTVAVRS